MAINPYTSPAEAPILDTYTPIPFDALAQAGALRQAKYEEGLAQEEALQSEFGNFQSLSEMQLPGLSKSIAVKDRQTMEGILSDYKAQIDELSTSLPDKSTPEYRAKIRSLMSNFRRDAGPTGRLGILQNNYQQVNDFYKRLEENPQLQNNPHLLVPFINRMRSYASRSGDGVSSLNLSGAIGEGVNIHKELGDILKQISSSVLSPAEIQSYGDNVPGLLKLVQTKGVSPDRIAETAIGLIQRNPQVYNDIQQQAAYSQMRGENLSPTDIAKGYVQDAINVYSNIDQNVKTFFEPGTGTDATSRRNKINRDFSANVVTYLPGTGLKNMTEVGQAMTASEESIAQARDQYSLALREFGIMDENGSIQKNEDGSINYRVKDPVTGLDRDYSDAIIPLIEGIASAEKKKQALNQLVTETRKEAGYTEQYLSSPQYQENLRKAQEEAQKNFQFKLNTRQGFDGMTNEDWLEAETQRLLSKTDPRAKKYNEILENKAKDGTFTAGLTTLNNPTLTKEVEDQFMLNFPGYKMTTGSIKSMDPDKKAAELTEDDFEKLSITEKNKPRFMGFFADDSEQGKLKLAFAVKDEDGNIVDRVKIDAFTGMEQDLIASGAINEGKMIINRQLTGELGALGNIKSEDTLVFGDGENALKINVKDKNNVTGKYIAEIPVYDSKVGKNILVPKHFEDKIQMINWITDKVTLYYSKQNK